MNKETLRQELRDAIDRYYEGDPVRYAKEIDRLIKTYGKDLVKEVVRDELKRIRQFLQVEQE